MASRRLLPTSMAIRAEISLLRSLIRSAARLRMVLRSFHGVAAHVGAKALAAAMAPAAAWRGRKPASGREQPLPLADAPGHLVQDLDPDLRLDRQHPVERCP